MAFEAFRKPNILSVSPQPRKGVFAALSPEETAFLLQSSKHISLRKGSFLGRSAQNADKFFVILSGELEISRTARRGKSFVLNRIGEGDVVGEVSALGEIPRTADVVCATDCEVAELSLTEFKRILSRVPNFAAFIMKTLSQRLVLSSSKLFVLATEDVRSRVLHTPRSLESCTHEDYQLVRERPTHAELARIVGTSREVVARALRLLEETGEIQQDGKTIYVKAA